MNNLEKRLDKIIYTIEQFKVEPEKDIFDQWADEIAQKPWIVHKNLGLKKICAK